MSGKTRVLVTHALDCLPKVDWIIIMENGQITFDGSFEELWETKFYIKIEDSLDSSH